jgi:hypothetical protein
MCSQSSPHVFIIPVTHAEDYRYALERDKKPQKARRPSLREGLLSRGALPSGLGSLTISTANSVNTSSEFGSAMASGRDDYGGFD